MPEPIPFDLIDLTAVIRAKVDERPVRYTIEELRGFVGNKMGVYIKFNAHKKRGNWTLAENQFAARDWAGGTMQAVPREIVLSWARQFIDEKMDENPRWRDQATLGGRKS